MYKHYPYDSMKDGTNVANHDNLDAFYDNYDIVLPRASNDRRSKMNDQNKKQNTDKYSNKKDSNQSSNKKDSNKKDLSEYR